jgi:hypothetical protein
MLAGHSGKPYSNRMDVRVTPETAKKLNDLATTSGRAPAVDGEELSRQLREKSAGHSR